MITFYGRTPVTVTWQLNEKNDCKAMGEMVTKHWPDGLLRFQILE